MDEKFYDSLELNKILEMLSKECSNEKTKKMALGIKPCSDLYTVKKETGKTAEALELSVRYGTPNFYNINDVSTYIKRAEAGGVLSLGELIQIRRLLAQTYELHHWYEQCENKDTSLSYLFEMLYPNKYLQQRLETAIIDDTKLSDDASAELRSIRQKITRSGLKIRETLDKMIKSPSTQKYLQESIVTMRDGRFVLPVKTEFKGNVSGLVHDTSATGSTLFIEPMSVVEANNDIRILQGQEQDEIHRIIAEFSMECAEMKDQLISNYNAVTELNLYFAKANLGAKMRAMLPEISNDGVIVLNKARHPLIDPKKVVPINFSIGTDYHSLIITGPNTGGKTVVLKTVGLLTLMTMCGLLIPASDGSRISVYKNVLVDIGDQQSIENNLSTFSSHISRVKTILDEADSESLVLLDELGSGTDPVEGAALAMSILEELHSRNTVTVATTHYSEVKAFALTHDGIENASMEFDVDRLCPTYRLFIGIPGKSNAFEISKRLGLDEGVIDRARTYLKGEDVHFEDIISSAQSRYQLAEEERAMASAARRDLDKLRQETEAERRKLEADRAKYQAKAKDEARRIVEDTRREMDKLIADIRSIKGVDRSAADRVIQQSRDALRKRRDDLAEKLVLNKEDGTKPPKTVNPGDTVRIVSLDKKATVLSRPDSKGEVQVQAGVMKLNAKLADLRMMQDDTPQKGVGKIRLEKDRQVGMELDIRGMLVDDAILVVDRYIDNAVLSGLTEINIIHGKGTGALRAGIQDYLRTNKRVKSFRLGNYGEGDAGVTVVTLKETKQ